LVKDTLANIRETGEFVVNVVSCKLARQMNQTSAAYPGAVSEFDAAALAAQPSAVVRPPGVRDSLVRFECALRQLIPFGDQPFSGNLVLGDIRHIYLHPDIYRDGKVDFAGIDAIGRLAGNFYATTRDRFQMARPVIRPEG
jgi:flavin reductase (DIM6/NTAB) family NADH-FMN oxidoreductase RutF